MSENARLAGVIRDTHELVISRRCKRWVSCSILLPQVDLNSVPNTALTDADIGVPVSRSPNPLSPVRDVDAFGNQIFYRTMSPEQYEILMETGRLPATTETSISPVLSRDLRDLA